MNQRADNYDMWARLEEQLNVAPNLHDFWELYRSCLVSKGSIPPVFHYTSPEGLLGIIKDRKPKIWLSRSDSLKDVHEGKEILELYKNICAELRNSHQISEEMFLDIKDLCLPKKIQFYWELGPNKFEKFMAGYDIFIGSFSLDRDSLPMWNYYSKNGRYEGYCIEIVQSDRNLHLYQVIYDDIRKAEIIRYMLKRYGSFYNKDTRLTVIDHLQQSIYDWHLIFKKKHFAYEREVRSIVCLPKPSMKDGSHKVDFRAQNGLIIPFFIAELPPECIRSVTISPMLKTETAYTNTRYMLDSKGFTEVDVHISEIDLR